MHMKACYRWSCCWLSLVDQLSKPSFAIAKAIRHLRPALKKTGYLGLSTWHVTRRQETVNRQFFAFWVAKPWAASRWVFVQLAELKKFKTWQNLKLELFGLAWKLELFGGDLWQTCDILRCGTSQGSLGDRHIWYAAIGHPSSGPRTCI